MPNGASSPTLGSTAYLPPTNTTPTFGRRLKFSNRSTPSSSSASSSAQVSRCTSPEPRSTESKESTTTVSEEDTHTANSSKMAPDAGALPNESSPAIAAKKNSEAGAAPPADTKVTKYSIYGDKTPRNYGPKATWHLKERKDMSFFERIAKLAVAEPHIYEARPDRDLKGPPPKHPLWLENFFVCSWAVAPMLVHFALNRFVLEPYGMHLHWAAGLLMYHAFFFKYAKHMIYRLHWYMGHYGTFDEQARGRDMVGDNRASQLGKGVFVYMMFRTSAPFMLAWRGDMSNPFTGLDIFTPIRMGIWFICLDYFFYLYHRSSHEFDSLWWIHRQHHATKHPTPLLSILADDVQEALEIFIVPILAYCITPFRMSFSELFLTVSYTLYVEALGHSGIRAIWPQPLLGWILRPLGMDLQIEDHDLHHRFGKSGRNYGKQTRIWDKLFGTIGERIETPLY